MCYVALIPAALALVGGMQQSKASKDQAEYQSKITENNAVISGYQGREAARQGKAAAQDHMRKVAQVRGQQVATLASRGLDIGEGSALALLQDTDAMGKQDTNQIIRNSKMQTWGFDVQKNNNLATADMMQTTADNINPVMDGLMSGGKAFMGAGGTGSGTISDAWASLWKTNDGGTVQTMSNQPSTH